MYIEKKTVHRQVNLTIPWHTLLWIGRSIYIEETVDRQPNNCGSAISPLEYPIVGCQPSNGGSPLTSPPRPSRLPRPAVINPGHPAVELNVLTLR